ncbi:eukaryotic translation initiation factor 2 subunit 1-like isoform X1 [Xenia sp. Carnegie-2017]|uniref:eukaryotic translation initiation factor 2 subunit 1-like isoform X1 n=1 Tax=Xenia sp. Carnegie-2017 TaxID=2897299 RepID=UPI001F04ADEF|nr:eukaryotic translation initiation factor 2 subunit 1-like isoform X1 [Xenia sp. Carnegie-2017]
MTTTMNREEGLKALETSIKAIEEVIMNKKGTFVLQQAINPISPPTYVVTTTTMNLEEGLKALETSIEEVIMNKIGTFVLQQAPKVVTDMDEADFAKELEKLERQNAEVDGDGDNPDDEE